MCQEILNGIVIGAAGGASAGLIIWGFTNLSEYIKIEIENKRVHKWLDMETKPDDTKKWRSTRAIASYNNLTENRVRYICSKHDNIALSTKDKSNELWGIKNRVRS